MVMAALQQGFPELLFQLTHLPANRALRDIQQFGGTCEAAGAASHFKGFERIERGHFSFQGRL
jgi:hypothetical protein